MSVKIRHKFADIVVDEFSFIATDEDSGSKIEMVDLAKFI